MTGSYQSLHSSKSLTEEFLLLTFQCFINPAHWPNFIYVVSITLELALTHNIWEETDFLGMSAPSTTNTVFRETQQNKDSIALMEKKLSLIGTLCSERDLFKLHVLID